MLTHQTFLQCHKTLVQHFLDDPEFPENSEAALKLVDRFVDMWRSGAVWRIRKLYEAIGLTESEYIEWLKNPGAFSLFIRRRRIRIGC